jgi:hypothetical protein
VACARRARGADGPRQRLFSPDVTGGADQRQAASDDDGKGPGWFPGRLPVHRWTGPVGELWRLRAGLAAQRGALAVEGRAVAGSDQRQAAADDDGKGRDVMARKLPVLAIARPYDITFTFLFPFYLFCMKS